MNWKPWKVDWHDCKKFSILCLNNHPDPKNGTKNNNAIYAINSIYDDFRPFWLEKFNALSGQFIGLERELLNSSQMLKEFLLEPSAIPINPSIPTDSIPNILLRSKLAPEVQERVSRCLSDANNDDSRIKLFNGAVRGLQEHLASLQEDLQKAAGEQVSLLLANEIGRTSGTVTPATIANSRQQLDEDFDAILENTIRWIYTGEQ